MSTPNDSGADFDATAASDPALPPDLSDSSGYAAGIYGTIIAASVLAAGANDTTLSIIVLVVVTLVVYWLAEEYARALAHSLVGHRPHRAAIWRDLRAGLPMVQASYLPVGVLIVCWLAGLDTDASVNIALTACTVVLFVLGWRGGARRELLFRGRLLSAAIAGSFGLVVIVLKLVVTH